MSVAPRSLSAEQLPVTASDLIREARYRAQLTQVQLAARAGVTQSVISTYENGRREPSLVALQRLVRAAGFAWRVELVPVAEPPSLRERLERCRGELVTAFASLGAGDVRLVGAVARGESGPDTVVDFVVDLSPGSGLFALMRMQDVAERILGTRVEVLTGDTLAERDGAQALREAVPL